MHAGDCFACLVQVSLHRQEQTLVAFIKFIPQSKHYPR